MGKYSHEFAIAFSGLRTGEVNAPEFTISDGSQLPNLQVPQVQPALHRFA